MIIMKDHFNLNLQLFGSVSDGAESNLVTKSRMAKVREVDFVERFTHNMLRKLMDALGVTRKVAMSEGTTMYVYRTTGTLQSGSVAEGAIIPLSQYERERTPAGEIALKKWRKAVTAEAIMKSGAEEALRWTDEKMLSDIQKGIRSDFFAFLTGLDGTVIGASTLQAVLAQTWGRLQTLFEDDAIEAVHFMNPLTIADYLATATISTQTAFGMSYIEDFLGMGTVVLSSNVPKGQVISTAKENIILYYLSMTGDVAARFDLTTDESGFIGMHTSQTDNRAQIEMLVMSGLKFLVEYPDGVVIGQIDATPTLQTITVTSTGTGATASGDSLISVSGYSLGTGEGYVYKTAKDTAPSVSYGQKLGDDWSELSTAAGTNITPAATHNRVTVAAVDANGRAQASGSATLTLKA